MSVSTQLASSSCSFRLGSQSTGPTKPHLYLGWVLALMLNLSRNTLFDTIKDVSMVILNLVKLTMKTNHHHDKVMA